MSKPDGGPAFPRAHVPATVTDMGNWQHHTPFVPAQDGMTLRDYFAAAALSGALYDASINAADLAKDAYGIADAMLAARDKP